MKRLVLLSFVLAVMLPVPGAVANLGVKITFDSRLVGILENPKLEPHNNDPNSVNLHFNVKLFSSFTEELDHTVRAWGNLTDSRFRRLYWVSGTSIHAYGNPLFLSSQVRYGLWPLSLLGFARVQQWQYSYGGYFLTAKRPHQTLRVFGV